MCLQHVPGSFSEHHGHAEKETQGSLDSCFITTGDKLILLINETDFHHVEKKRLCKFLFCYNTFTKLPREMLKSYYLISLYAYHLIYTSKDILKTFKRSVLFEDKKLFTEAIIPTIKNSIQYQSQKTAIRHMDDDRAYIKCGITNGHYGGGKQRGNPNELKSLTLIKELPGYGI